MLWAMQPLGPAIDDVVNNLLSQMTLAEQVGQLHMPANADAVGDADDLAGGRIGATLGASGPTAGNERDAGAQRSQVESVQQVAAKALRRPRSGCARGVLEAGARARYHVRRFPTRSPLPLRSQLLMLSPVAVAAAAKVRGGLWRA